MRIIYCSSDVCSSDLSITTAIVRYSGSPDGCFSPPRIAPSCHPPRYFMLASRSEPPPLVDLPHPLRGIATWACGEDYRLVAAQERAMMDMSMDSAREDLRLDIAPQDDIVCGALRMFATDRVLIFEDRKRSV